MAKKGVPVPIGEVATTPDEAYAIAKKYQKTADAEEVIDVVIKAQVLSGGRGLGYFDSGLIGGVHTCTSPEEVKEYATGMLGHRLKTKQTPPEGALCNKVLVTERLFTRHEGYLAFMLDRETSGPIVVASTEGGTDIERVAKEYPELIKTFPIDARVGITDQIAEDVAVAMGFGKSRVKSQAVGVVKNMYDVFMSFDCTQAEINPLVEDLNARVVAVDAKFNFDSNAEYRQPEIFALKDETQADPRDVAAAQAGLNYIGLDGNIGCMVNGAGLAMATMDIIKQHGGSPANFLDVGGGATEDQVIDAFKILSDDPNVQVILVNIFGGIMRCDVIAAGILNAVQKLGLRCPLVVRLEGTNVKEAKALLESSPLRVLAANDLDDAAQKAVKVSGIVDLAKEAKLDVAFQLPL